MCAFGAISVAHYTYFISCVRHCVELVCLLAQNQGIRGQLSDNSLPPCTVKDFATLDVFQIRPDHIQVLLVEIGVLSLEHIRANMMEHIREIFVAFILEYVPEQFVKMKLFDWFFLLILYLLWVLYCARDNSLTRTHRARTDAKGKKFELHWRSPPCAYIPLLA